MAADKHQSEVKDKDISITELKKIIQQLETEIQDRIQETETNKQVNDNGQSIHGFPPLDSHFFVMKYSKTCVKWPLSKRSKIGFQDQLSLNAGQKFCRMLQGEQSAILSTFINLPFVIKIFVLSILEWSFYFGSTV